MFSQIPEPDRCIACSSCLAVCPVAQADRDFPGPRLLGPVHERFRKGHGGMDQDALLALCSNCKNCEIACPCDVPVSALILRARNELGSRKPLRDWLLAHSDTLGRLSALAPARLKNAVLRLPPARTLLDFLGIARKASLPAFSGSFTRRLRALKQPGGLTRRAAIFPGCFVELYDAECGLDLAYLLNMAGYRVISPPRPICCGLPLLAGAFREDAGRRAAANLAVLRRWREEGVPVLAPCTSCSLTINEDYRQHFPDLSPPEESLVEDACSFLLGCLDRGELVLPDTPGKTGGDGGPRRVVYHAPCHLRAQGLGLPGLALLRRLPGYTAQNAAAGCCGLSGSYGFKKEKYELSLRIGEPLFQAIRLSGAEEAASECGACRMRISHVTGLKTLHPISMLARMFTA